MNLSIRRQEIALGEVAGAESPRSSSDISLFYSLVSRVDQRSFGVVRLVPPCDCEFADLAIPLPIYLELGARGDASSKKIQRELARQMKAVGFHADLLPDDGLPVVWGVRHVEFVAEWNDVTSAMQALDRFVATVGDKSTAPSGAYLSEPSPESYEELLWDALVGERLPNESARLEATLAALRSTESRRPIPRELRYRLLTGLSLIDLSSNRIEPSNVAKAALVNRLDDPCLATTVDAALRFAESKKGIELRILAGTAPLDFGGVLLAWKDELRDYLQRMQIKYPVYWAGLDVMAAPGAPPHRLLS